MIPKKRIFISILLLILCTFVSIPIHEWTHVVLHKNVTEVHILDAKAFAIGATGYIITNDTTNKLGLNVETEEILVQILSFIEIFVMFTFVFIFMFYRKSERYLRFAKETN